MSQVGRKAQRGPPEDVKDSPVYHWPARQTQSKARQGGRCQNDLLYISDYKMAGMFCLSKKPFWQTFIAQAKGDNLSPQSRAPIGSSSRHSAKQRPQLPHEPRS